MQHPQNREGVARYGLGMTLADVAPPAGDSISDRQRDGYEANGVLGSSGGRICGGEASQMLTIGGRQMATVVPFALSFLLHR